MKHIFLLDSCLAFEAIEGGAEDGHALAWAKREGAMGGTKEAPTKKSHEP